MPPSSRYRPSRRHADLGADFYDVVLAAEFPQHILRYRNQRWAARVGLDQLDDAEWTQHFGRFVPLPGSFPEPLALRYHGHQFRVYNPQLGDGRGFLFAQLHELDDGRLLDLGTKGSGRTPWSRGADGRLTLKGGVRELLASSMLEALGVDTSKTFSLIETGEELARNDEPSPTRSSVLVRLSHSHIRIGSFQRFAYHEDRASLSRLLDHAVATYLPEAWREEEAARAVAFLERVCALVARTGAQWIAAGFVHGVLNTDNINITGESFDYGPWRFLPTYDPGFTAAYFDESGLYCVRPAAGDAAVEPHPARRVPAPACAAGGAGDCAGKLSAGVPRSPRGSGAGAAWVTLRRRGRGRRRGRAAVRFPRANRRPRSSVPSSIGAAASRARSAPPRSPSAVLYAGEAFAPLREAMAALEPEEGALAHPYFTGPAALHDADRRGRGAVGVDRRRGRLGSDQGQARRNR